LNSTLQMKRNDNTVPMKLLFKSLRGRKRCPRGQQQPNLPVETFITISIKRCENFLCVRFESSFRRVGAILTHNQEQRGEVTMLPTTAVHLRREQAHEPSDVATFASTTAFSSAVRKCGLGHCRRRGAPIYDGAAVHGALIETWAIRESAGTMRAGTMRAEPRDSIPGNSKLVPALWPLSVLSHCGRGHEHA